LHRQAIIDYYQKNPEVSVLIIGAGVNGIGTFRDLALQGIDVLIVDKSDFCSGASSASSHMIHGGIRYLENGEFQLVREAVKERNLLLSNAPHYVKPLKTVIPIFKWFSGIFNAPIKFLGLLDEPSERGVIVIKIGLILYDLFSGSRAFVPKHRIVSGRDSKAQFPQINPDVKVTAQYYDAAMLSPERICVEMVLDGEATKTNAHAINYVKIENASGEKVRLKDQLTDQYFWVQPKIVINAAGPWIDFVNASLDISTQFIQGTKGSHLILNNRNLRTAIGDNEFFFENNDGRIVLIYPLYESVLVGTSDLPIRNPEYARCTQDEIDYFIDMVSIIFPDISITTDQIIFQYSGVRPLPASGARTAGQISRNHSIKVIPAGEYVDFPIYCLVGGKWTSFRSFSEEVTDQTLNALNRDRIISTRDLPIGGGRNYPNSSSEYENWIERQVIKSGISRERVKILFERYGTRSSDILNIIMTKPDKQLSHLSEYSLGEIQFITDKEKVVHLDDFFLRRSMLSKIGRLSREIIQELADAIGKELEWSTERTQNEVDRSIEILREHHGISI
jgi:glycerol-3-phosphate dehydrogenase